jgi:hypothetical protein
MTVRKAFGPRGPPVWGLTPFWNLGVGMSKTTGASQADASLEDWTVAPVPIFNSRNVGALRTDRLLGGTAP